MDSQGNAGKATATAAAASRASSVSLSDFSEALSSGVLRAISANPIKLEHSKFEPWIWAGWWIGNRGPFDPGGPGTGFPDDPANRP